MDEAWRGCTQLRILLLVAVLGAAGRYLRLRRVDDLPVLACVAGQLVPHDDGAPDAHFTDHLEGQQRVLVNLALADVLLGCAALLRLLRDR